MSKDTMLEFYMCLSKVIRNIEETEQCGAVVAAFFPTSELHKITTE
jgi:hypothetical protein